jgi:Amidohydrolase family
MRLLSLAFAVAGVVCGVAIPVVIQDVAVVDIATSTVQPHMTVMIDGENIKAITTTVAARVPAGSRIVVGTGKFLIPGLWDMHVHLGYLENQLPAFIAYGVTGVQDMGSDFSRTSAWRAAIDSGKAVGPRIVTSGPPVNGVPSDDDKLPVIVAKTPEEARKAFDRLYEMDVDFVKVLSGLSADAYFALAEQARHQHMRLVGHVPASISAWDAIESRQASIEHLFGVMKSVATDEEALRFFDKCALYGVRISPTLVLWQRMAHMNDDKLSADPRLKFVPESARKAWPALKDEGNEPLKKQIEGIYKLVGLTTRTKVEVLAGTDTGDPWTIAGGTLHDELEQMVAAGLSPHQALAAATMAPARFFEWEDAMGTVEVGKMADLVMLEANPLVDIRNVRKTAAVFARGKYYSRRDLDRILNSMNPVAKPKVAH